MEPDTDQLQPISIEASNRKPLEFVVATDPNQAVLVEERIIGEEFSQKDLADMNEAFTPILQKLRFQGKGDEVEFIERLLKTEISKD